jgi:superfamily II DNA helicase RecQ
MLTGVRLLAISATITPEARIDLSKRLYLYTGHYFQASYHRSNLFYGILKCKGKD